MLSGKTVFIIGAGASADFGMPVGLALAETIKGKLFFRNDDVHFRIGDQKFLERTRDLMSFENFSNAAYMITRGIGLASSIDDFLDSHRDNPNLVTCGKAAIAHSILEFENRSALHGTINSNRGWDADISVLDKVWLNRFVRIVSRGITTSNVTEIFNDVTFINFNYDRCLETYLIQALVQRFSIDQLAAQEIVENAKIYHPYGTVGSPFPGRNGFVKFGDEYANIAELGANIKTYTEKITDHTLLSAMVAALAAAQTLVFLGFAFHPQNMNLMRVNWQDVVMPKTILATAFNCSDAAVETYRQRISQMFPNEYFPQAQMDRFRFSKVTCLPFLEEFEATLSG